MKFLNFLCLALLMLVSACSDGVGDGEEIGIVDPLKKGHKIVPLERAAIEKGEKFLFTAAQISGPPAPTGNALRSKVVQLVPRNNEIIFYEVTDGKLASPSIPSEIPLFRLPIRRDLSNEEYIAVDFDANTMIYSANSYYLSDYSSENTNEELIVSNESIVEKAYALTAKDKKEYIFIEQNVRAIVGGTTQAFKMKYSLSKYVENKDFTPLKSLEQKEVGFFENWPVYDLSNESQNVNVFKFDTSKNKKIVFSVSSNVPTEWRQAVDDGIYYWNEAFGKKVLEVQDLDADVSVHEPGYNIVQWIKWDTAGFAYADMQADPLTGETLQAHVYMTSVFATSGFKKAKKFLQESELEEKKFVALGLKGFQNKKHLCSYGKTSKKELASVINKIDRLELSDEEKDEIYKRYTADYVREVVAHEIGHTLGLRHNFAGSLHTEVTSSEFPEIFESYLRNGIVPTRALGSTVMDYSPNKVSALIGAHIKKAVEGEVQALPYDKKAIDWGYNAKSIDELPLIPFCTDSHNSTYQDCKVWDRFANPIENAKYQWNNTINEFAFNMLSRYLFLLEADTEDSKKEKKFKKLSSFDTRAQINSLMADFHALRDMLKSEAQFKTIRDSYDQINSSNEVDYQEATTNFQYSNIEGLGQVSDLLFHWFKIDSNSLETRALQTIREDFTSTFEKLYGDIDQSYQDAIKIMAEKFFEQFDREFLMAFSQSIKADSYFDLDPNFIEELNSIVKPVLFANSETEIESAKGAPASLPYYFLKFTKDGSDIDLRTQVAKLLTHNFFSQSPFYLKEVDKIRQTTYDQHQQEIEAVLGGVNEQDIESEELYNWLQSEKSVFSSLKKGLVK